MSEKDLKKYELAYWVRAGENEETARDIVTTLEKESGTLGRSEAPAEKTLAYPIDKIGSAYFGWVQFSTDQSRLPDIQEKIRNVKSIIRFLITRVPPEQKQKKPRKIVEQHKPAHKTALVEKEEKRINLEEIDKKLEEILK